VSILINYVADSVPFFMTSIKAAKKRHADCHTLASRFYSSLLRNVLVNLGTLVFCYIQSGRKAQQKDVQAKHLSVQEQYKRSKKVMP